MRRKGEEMKPQITPGEEQNTGGKELDWGQCCGYLLGGNGNEGSKTLDLGRTREEPEEGWGPGWLMGRK